MSLPSSSDVLFDVGCGDGRVLARCWGETECRRMVGVEVDEGRAEEARANTKGLEGVEIVCGNAMEVNTREATVVFLYLVPRGLRIYVPVLLGHFLDRVKKEGEGATLKVCTYMSPIPGAGGRLVEKRVVEVEHQEGARWPVYYYLFSGEGAREVLGGGGGAGGGATTTTTTTTTGGGIFAAVTVVVTIVAVVALKKLKARKM